MIDLLVLSFFLVSLCAPNPADFSDIPDHVLEEHIFPKASKISLENNRNLRTVSRPWKFMTPFPLAIKEFSDNLVEFFDKWGQNAVLNMTQSFQPQQDVKDLSLLNDWYNWLGTPEHFSKEFGKMFLQIQDVSWRLYYPGNHGGQFYSYYEHESGEMNFGLYQIDPSNGAENVYHEGFTCKLDNFSPVMDDVSNKYKMTIVIPTQCIHPEMDEVSRPDERGYRILAVIFEMQPDDSIDGKCAGVLHLRPFIGPKPPDAFTKTFVMRDGKIAVKQEKQQQ